MLSGKICAPAGIPYARFLRADGPLRLIRPPDPRKPERRYSRWGGFLAEVDRFDARFFNITPRDAREIDPQERIFLETSWEAVENAGYSPETLARKVANEVGVFAGAMWSEYQLHGPHRDSAGNVRALNSSFAGIANRVSFTFDWHGPSMTVDTMCSSSLTAIHLACESLRRGECRMALAGGVNVSIHPNKYLLIGQNQFASSDGHCRSFGEGGDGYVPGEGAGAVLLKPLSAAIADGDHIHGVIRGSALNHGGQGAGYTVPNPKAQSSVIRKALAVSGVEPRTIGYIEAHGAGTSLGDPVEIRGLMESFGSDTPCPIGSVKSNIGHLESAAGIAAVTKVLLQLQHGEFAPSLHAQRLNPNIDWEHTPFFVQQEAAAWERKGDAPRRASVSSFGAGGANAHLILEEYSAPAHEVSAGPQIVALSARNRERLQESSRRLLAFLRGTPAPAFRRGIHIANRTKGHGRASGIRGAGYGRVYRAAGGLAARDARNTQRPNRPRSPRNRLGWRGKSGLAGAASKWRPPSGSFANLSVSRTTASGRAKPSIPTS